MNQVGKPVFGNNLIGREKEIQLIKQLILSGQSVVIIAPRRMGKTSLMLEVLRQLQQESFFTVNVDVFSTSNIPTLASRISESVFSNQKLDKYFRLALNNITEAFKNVKFKSEIEDYSFILEFNTKAIHSPFDLLEDSLNLIEHYATKNRKKIVAAFDEFGDIDKLDGNHIVKLFRSVIQHQKNSTYIFSGSYESVMSELFLTKNAPFYRMTRIIELGNISFIDFSDYIKKVFQNYGILIVQSRIDEILDFTKGHPYYTQLYIQELLIQYNMSTNQDLVLHKELVSQLLWVEKSFLEKNWEEISNKKENRTLILAITKGVNNIYSEITQKNINIARAINNLKKQGIISKVGSQYQINDPLFKEWLVRNVL